MRKFQGNKIAVIGDIAEITLLDKDKNISGIALIDAKDVPLVSKYTWHKNSWGYVATNPNGQNKFRGKLHTLLLGEGCLDTDHFNRNKLDNRRCNLRKVTTSINNYNSSLRKDNTSGRQGVSYSKKHRKWIAQIFMNRKCKYLGSYNSYAEAVNVRERAEILFISEPLYMNPHTKNKGY